MGLKAAISRSQCPRTEGTGFDVSSRHIRRSRCCSILEMKLCFWKGTYSQRGLKPLLLRIRGGKATWETESARLEERDITYPCVQYPRHTPDVCRYKRIPFASLSIPDNSEYSVTQRSSSSRNHPLVLGFQSPLTGVISSMNTRRGSASIPNSVISSARDLRVWNGSLQARGDVGSLNLNMVQRPSGTRKHA